ncbi:MAG: hypothetical protein LC802_04645 [Acidobacteria bacterium]|nr:hypothetical protein [Acidobacteriota bacterium]
MSERLPARAAKALLSAALLLPLCGAPRAGAQEMRGRAEAAAAVTEGSLAELKSLRRVMLLVTRSLVVDARDPGKALVREAYGADPQTKRRHRFAFNPIAQKLNDYMKKYGGMSASQEVGDAEYILVFNLLEYKRVLGRYYPYGEMYVVLNQPPDSPQSPRILWRGSKVLWAEDAASEFIRELKAVRGQK